MIRYAIFLIKCQPKLYVKIITIISQNQDVDFIKPIASIPMSKRVRFHVMVLVIIKSLSK